MEFLHNIMICQFEFEASNQQFNSFVITRNLGGNFSTNLLVGGLEKFPKPNKREGWNKRGGRKIALNLMNEGC